MPKASINIASSQGALLIDSGARPYFFDLDQTTFWPAGSSTVITNNSSYSTSFVGNMTLEGAAGSTVVTLWGGSGGGNATWTGYLLNSGQAVSTNNLRIGTINRALDSVDFSDGSVFSGGQMSSLTHTITTTGETVILYGTDAPQGYLLSVRMNGTNWNYAYLFMVTAGVGGTGAQYAQLANTLGINVSGWGAPTFTNPSGSPSNLSVTNANWTSGTTVQWSIIPFGMIPRVI